MQPLFVDGDLNGISAESVEGIDEDDLPFLRAVAVRKHSLKFCSVVIGARHGAVDIRPHNTQIVALCKFVTDTKLTFDGLLRLPLTAIPRVNNCNTFLWTQVCAGIAGMYNWGVFNFGKRAIKEQCKGRCMSYF